MHPFQPAAGRPYGAGNMSGAVFIAVTYVDEERRFFFSKLLRDFLAGDAFIETTFNTGDRGRKRLKLSVVHP